MMSVHGANLIFFNKNIKIESQEQSLTPYTPTPDNISFLPYLPTPVPPQSGRHMCITPYDRKESCLTNIIV